MLNEKLRKFIDNYGSAFFIASLVNENTIYLNKFASKIFGVTAETCDFTKIFDSTETYLITNLLEKLQTNKQVLYHNLTVVDANKNTINVDVQLGFFDEEETEIFLELIPSKDIRMEMALHQVNQAARAEAILNLDDKLSIVHCNDAFHNVFDSSEELRHSHFHNDLINGFLPEVKEKLISDILSHLGNNPTYATKLQVFTAIGEERWYLFELEKRTLDDSGQDKIMAYMTNIERQVEIEQGFSAFQQYFEAMESLSGESLYTIDVKSKVLRQTGQVAKELGIPPEVEGYPESVFGMIHWEDLEGFKEFAKESLAGTPSHCTIRVKISEDSYCWYELFSMIIRNDKGEVTEIFGKIQNIQLQKELELRASMDLMTNVFNKVSFQEEVTRFLSKSVENQQHALVFVDLDDFKGVNDTLGHIFGDSLLISVGERLKSASQEQDIVGRLGGDEFAVLLQNVQNKDDALKRGNILLDSLQNVFSFDGKERTIKASLGIAVFPEDGSSYIQLIAKSDFALYASKAKGKNVATVYTKELEEC